MPLCIHILFYEENKIGGEITRAKNKEKTTGKKATIKEQKEKRKKIHTDSSQSSSRICLTSLGEYLDKMALR